MNVKIKATLMAACLAGAIGVLATPAFAATGITQSVRAGREFTRQASEIVCTTPGGCRITWTRKITTQCSRKVDVRLRLQRNLAPDQTEVWQGQMTGCQQRTWAHRSEYMHGHHQDARISRSDRSHSRVTVQFGAK